MENFLEWRLAGLLGADAALENVNADGVPRVNLGDIGERCLLRRWEGHVLYFGEPGSEKKEEMN